MSTTPYSEFRSLTQAAGVAVANGLPWDRALRALTEGPAEIWGIEVDGWPRGKWLTWCFGTAIPLKSCLRPRRS